MNKNLSGDTEGVMQEENAALTDRGDISRQRNMLRSKMGEQSREFNRLSMVIRSVDPCGTKVCQYLRGIVPPVRNAAWLQVLKTLSLEGLCQCLVRIPRHDRALRKAIVVLITIRRLEMMDRGLARSLAQQS